MEKNIGLYALPTGWSWKKMKEICTLITDGTHKTPNYVDKGVPFISIANIQPFAPITFRKYVKYISKKEHQELSLKAKVEKDDILFPRIGTLGYAKRVDWDFEASIFVGLGLAKPRKNLVLPKFLEYYLNTQLISRYSRERANGSGRLTLPLSASRDLPVPLPPIVIQQAIVSKIEELFSELDKGIEQLKIAQEQLKTYRQAILKWAFNGRLTNPNVESGVFPSNWKWVTLDQVSTISGGVTKNAKRALLHLQVPFLRVANVYSNYLDLNEIHTIGITDAEMNRVTLKKNDLLFVEGNGSIDQVGRVALWSDEIKNCVHQNHLIKCRFSDSIEPKYVLYFYCSDLGRSYVKERANSTSGLHTLSISKISSLPIPLCSLQEQQAIIQEIELRLSIANHTAEIISQSLQQSESLRQSILKMAFEGRLTETSTLESVEASVKEIPEERKVLAARIIHMFEKDKNFGLTKFQKVFYLAENHAQVPYDTHYIKETAGPYDRDFTRAFRQEMQQEDWVQEEQRGNRTRLLPGDNIGKLEKEYAKYFRSKSKQIVFVIEQLMAKSTHEAELIATLYAVWNNRLIQKKTVKVDHLVDDFFSWSPKKIAEFQKEEIISTYKWMKGIDFVPTGFGKVIESVKD